MNPSQNFERPSPLPKLVRDLIGEQGSEPTIFKFIKQNYPRLLTKFGFMVGLEEMEEDGRFLLLDLLDHGCEIVIIGLYLRPFFGPLSCEAFH